MTTTSKGAPYPEPTDANDVPARLKQLAEWIDAHPGVSTLTTEQRDSLAGGDLWAGRVIFNVTAAQLELNKTGEPGAAKWRAIAPADAAAELASLRTLGNGAQQASPGNHTHDDRYYTETE